LSEIFCILYKTKIQNQITKINQVHFCKKSGTFIEWWAKNLRSRRSLR